MASQIIRKISILDKSGISLAEVPNTRDITEQQLEGGFITAILKFSKEVHKSELEALTFHDRVVSFLQFPNFTIIPEFSNGVDRTLIAYFSEKIFDSVNEIGVNLESTLNVEQAFLILNSIYNNDWLNSAFDELGLEQPLIQGEIAEFSKITNNNQFSDIFTKLENLQVEEKIITFLLPGGKESYSYIIVATLENGIKAYCLKIASSYNLILFKLLPQISDDVKFNFEKGEKNPYNLINDVKQTRDLGIRINEKTKEMMSMDLLLKTIKKLDQLVYSVILGKQILLIGDKPTVRIILNTLLLFTPHLNVQLVEWLEDGDTYIGKDLTGISIDKYNQLVENNAITDDTIIVDFRNGKVKNGISNKYIDKMLKNLNHRSLTSSEQYIKSELNDLVNLSLKITRLVKLPDDEGREKLNIIKNEIGDKNKYEVVLELSKQRNELITSIITSISETLKTAQSFLDEF